MSLVIQCPAGYEPERRYTFDVLFGEFLGVAYHLVIEDRDDVRIASSDDPDGPALTVVDRFFQTPADAWLTEASLPTGCFVTRSVPWQLESRRLPETIAIPADCDAIYREVDRGGHLAIDIFGWAFFFLSRYEERFARNRRPDNWYPSASVIAGWQRYLRRPIVNEYLELLWNALVRLWPRIARQPRRHRLLVSHDVDHPFIAPDAPALRTMKSSLADIVKRRDPVLAINRLRSRHLRHDADPFNTFPFILEMAERHGLRSAFYFIAGQTDPRYDSSYALTDPAIGRLMIDIHQHGHEIGVHPSYGSYATPGQVARELTNLRSTVDRLNIDQDAWGGRQHYLRWTNPDTWQQWDAAGLAYDSTLGFADAVGFRCGVCYEYPVYDLITRQPLRLRERPLIAMEMALLAFMKVGDAECVDTLTALNRTCQRHDGDFVLLWHNSSLISAGQRRLYSSVLDAIAG